MRNSNILRGAGVAIVLAAAVLAGCSGGGHSTATPSTPSNNTSANTGNSGSALSGKTTTASITFNIGSSTQAYVRNGQTIPAANAKSLVIKFVGDSNPTAAPTNPFAVPASAQVATIGTAAFVNLTTPNPPGNCTTIGSGATATLQCTISGLVLPVGTVDLYLLVYDAVGGTGNLIYGTVGPTAIAASGVLTNPNTGAAPVYTLGGNNAAPGVTIALSTAAAAVAPAAAALATSTPYAVSSALAIKANDANGIAISGTLAPVSVSINDTTGSVCLQYVAASTASPAPTATPCAVASVGATPAAVTVSNTGDSVIVQYNNKPVTLATSAPWKITAAIVSPAPSATAATTSIPVKFSAAAFSTSAPNNNNGAEVVIGSTLYIASGGSATTPAKSIEVFTLANGKLSAGTALPGTVTTGVDALQVAGTAGGYPTPTPSSSSATALRGTVVAMVQGSDTNLWFAENTSTGIAIGVYAVNTVVAGAAAVGAVAESVNIVATTPSFPLATGSTPALTTGAVVSGMAAAGGFVWVIDSKGDVIRVNPGVFTGSIAEDTSGTGINIALATITTAVTSTPGAGLGLGKDITVNGTMVGGMINNGSALLVPALVATQMTQISPVAAPTATAGGSFLTGTSSTDIKTSPAMGTLQPGNIVGSDGNFWGTTSANFVSTNLSTVSTGAAAGAATGITQGGLDNFLFTVLTASGGGVTYTNTGGTTTATIAAAACAGAPVDAATGQELAFVGNYLIYPYGTTSTATLCIVVP